LQTSTQVLYITQQYFFGGSLAASNFNVEVGGWWKMEKISVFWVFLPRIPSGKKLRSGHSHRRLATSGP